MINEAPAPSAGSLYIKVQNFTGLYRHSVSGRYYAVKKFQGKRRERSLETSDRKIAERRFKEWVASLEKVDSEVEKTTIKQLHQRFVAINQGKAESTLCIIHGVIREFEQWWKHDLNFQVRNVRPSHLEEWLAQHERKLKNTTYNRYAGVLRQIYDLAVKDRIIAESPFAGVRTKWKKPQTPVRNIPTLDQFQAIVDCVRSQPFTDHANDSADFVEFLGCAGLGQAEASSLTWGDVDFQAGRLSIRRHKTDTRFFVPIYAHLKPLMDRLKEKAGSKMAPNMRVLRIKDAKKALRSACEKLGLPRFSQRNLRQCLIMRLWKLNIDKKLIAKWQGHQDGGQLIMDTYTEVFGSDDADYELQQLAKIGPVEPVRFSLPVKEQGSPAVAPGSSKRSNRPAKFFLMENPFKKDDKVLTLVKGVEVAAVVSQSWKSEVQVKTPDDLLLWRTMHTVWFPGGTPIPKPGKAGVISAKTAPEASMPAGLIAVVALADTVATPVLHDEPVGDTMAEPQVDAPRAAEESLQPEILSPVVPPANVTSCGATEEAEFRRKKGKRRRR